MTENNFIHVYARPTVKSTTIRMPGRGPTAIARPPRPPVNRGSVRERPRSPSMRYAVPRLKAPPKYGGRPVVAVRRGLRRKRGVRKIAVDAGRRHAASRTVRPSCCGGTPYPVMPNAPSPPAVPVEWPSPALDERRLGLAAVDRPVEGMKARQIPSEMSWKSVPRWGRLPSVDDDVS